MKIILLFVVALVHGCCSGVYAQTKGKQLEFNSAWGVDYKSNLVVNPSAYKSLNGAAATGGTFTRDTTAGNKIDGKASFKWQGTALNQYVLFDLLAPSDEHKSGACEYKGKVKGSAGPNYSAQIIDGSSNVLTTVALPNSDVFADFSLGYPCGDTNTRFVVIKQTTAGTPAAINFGKIYFGPATNIGTYTPPITFTAKISATGVVTDQTPTGTTWILGNATVSATDVFAIPFTSGFFTSIPNCTATITSGAGTAQGIRTFNQATTGISVQSGNTVPSAQPFVISCTKTGADAPQTIVATQNQDSTDRIFFTPTVSGLGAGSGSFAPANWNYYTTNGINANICYRFIKDATPGAGAADVVFSLPPGVSADVGSFSVGTVGTNVTGMVPAQLFLENGQIKILMASGSNAKGSNITAGAVFYGCITIPTTSKKPTNGAVIVNTVSTNTGSSRVYFSGSYSAAGGLGNNCTTNPCTMPTNDGVLNVGRGGTGLYSINITAGQCADSLSCNIEASTPQKMAGGLGIGPTTYSFQTLNASNVSTDSWGTFNCSCKK